MRPAGTFPPSVEECFRADMATWPGGGHYDAAREAVARGHYHLITTNGRTLYLARFWTSPPLPSENGGLESGGSELLHRIVEPDDARAFHDHPWSFTSSVLAGGYVEERQTEDGLRREVRGVGSVAFRDPLDLHRVASVEPGTWTRVTTGTRRRTWGFWLPFMDYLAAQQKPPSDAQINERSARMIAAATTAQIEGLSMHSANTAAELRGERSPHGEAEFAALAKRFEATVEAIVAETGG
jgi:hypothetical protein